VNDVYVEMIKQAPLGAAMIIIVYLFLTTENKREQQRIENAKECELVDLRQQRKGWQSRRIDQVGDVLAVFLRLHGHSMLL